MIIPFKLDGKIANKEKGLVEVDEKVICKVIFLPRGSLARRLAWERNHRFLGQ